MVQFTFDREVTSRADEQNIHETQISVPDDFTGGAVMEVLVQRGWIPDQSNMVWVLCSGDVPVAFLFRNTVHEKQIYQPLKDLTAAQFPSPELHAYHRYYGAIDFKGSAFRDMIRRVLGDWGFRID